MASPPATTPRGDALYCHDGARVFRSDGTVAGTIQLPVVLPAGIESFHALSQQLVFGGGFGPL